MLRGYVITYEATYNYGGVPTYTSTYTSFFHNCGKYSWLEYQRDQQQVGNRAIPVHVKKTCRYPNKSFIGPRREI